MFRVLPFLVALAACGSSELASTEATPSQPATEAASQAAGAVPSQHAAADVVPGSHEDWCGEHAVPESQCTQCHSDLIAAFKATGDWCEEHGLPESHCKKCNPELVIERPAKGS